MLKTTKPARKLASGCEHMEAKRMRVEDTLAVARQTLDRADRNTVTLMSHVEQLVDEADSPRRVELPAGGLGIRCGLLRIWCGLFPGAGTAAVSTGRSRVPLVGFLVQGLRGGAGPEAVRQEGPARVVFRRGAGNGGLPNPVLCRGGTHDPLLPGALMERLGGAGARVVPGETPGPSAFGWPHPHAGGGPLLLPALHRDELRAAVGGGTHAYAIGGGIAPTQGRRDSSVNPYT